MMYILLIKENSFVIRIRYLRPLQVKIFEKIVPSLGNNGHFLGVGIFLKGSEVPLGGCS